MEKREILLFCKENGFFLDRGMLEYFSELDEVLIRKIIEKLKSFGISEKILSLRVFEKYKSRLSNLIGGKVDSGIEILKEFSESSGVEMKDFGEYFKSRFDKIRDILLRKNLDNLTSIRRLGSENGVFCIIGIVYDKRITKNKNLLIEIEDLTGRAAILVNRENKQLFKQAQTIMLDDVLAFKCSGSVKMLFANEFIYPDMKLENENHGNEDNYVAFISDLHIGSRDFLEDNFDRFIDWLNGNIGDNRSQKIASKIKYLILAGDLVDGIGVYPEQEKQLLIKSGKRQYEKLANILGKIRKDLEIIVLPGLHDLVWLGEPMLKIDRKWAGSLEDFSNIKMTSNPVFLEIGGLKILTYYGSGFKVLKNMFPKGEELDFEGLSKEILKRRCLNSIYGIGDIIPGKKGDDLILDENIDVLCVGGLHKSSVFEREGILGISTSCWKKKGNFEIDRDVQTDECRVPILNLKNKEVKVLDFSGENKICWEKGENLVCDISGGNK